MAELQTSYSETVPAGFPGMVANGETSNRITRTIEDAGGIGFGVPAARGTLDHGCTATVAAAADVLGITIATTALGLTAGATADTYAEHDNVAIMTGGAIYVDVVGAVAPGDPLTFGIGAGAADGIGNTAADATHIALTGWVADETVTDGVCRIVKR
ncbi:MAG: structural cement protein Gp24 [Methylocystis sp.]|uniref:structural cement protein Gp24 n=1 Tax=Methylocystis sp. TaxID=1911079 RepID=UPI003DA4B05D